MAGALLEFANGYLGFERCEDPKDGSQYLRAFIRSKSTGRASSSAVSVQKVVEFATEAVRQALLADGHNESDLVDLTWNSRAALGLSPEKMEGK